MKKLLLLIFATACLYAEATFDQVQSMIDKQQYKQAVLALTTIEKNHPESSKVQFTLAQAHAGLDNLPLAKEALDKAIAINPKLDFVPTKQVEELSKTINAVRVIKRVEESTNWTLWILLMVGTSFVVAFFLRSKPTSEEPKPDSKYDPTPAPKPYSPNTGLTKSAEPTSEAYTTPASGFDKCYNIPTKAHHHYTNNSSSSDILTTMAVAGVTAFAVSTDLDNDDRPTHAYQPEPVVSDSWQDRYASESTSAAWQDDESSKSNTWGSSSDSSSSDSWSSSSNNSSSDSSWSE
jgi:hypothetical protein